MWHFGYKFLPFVCFYSFLKSVFKRTCFKYHNPSFTIHCNHMYLHVYLWHHNTKIDGHKISKSKTFIVSKITSYSHLSIRFNSQTRMQSWRCCNHLDTKCKLDIISLLQAIKEETSQAMRSLSSEIMNTRLCNSDIV